MKDDNVGIFGTTVALIICIASMVMSSVPGAIVGAAMLICMEISSTKEK